MFNPLPDELMRILPVTSYALGEDHQSTFRNDKAVFSPDIGRVTLLNHDLGPRALAEPHVGWPEMMNMADGNDFCETLIEFCETFYQHDNLRAFQDNLSPMVDGALGIYTWIANACLVFEYATCDIEWGLTEKTEDFTDAVSNYVNILMAYFPDDEGYLDVTSPAVQMWYALSQSWWPDNMYLGVCCITDHEAECIQEFACGHQSDALKLLHNSHKRLSGLTSLMRVELGVYFRSLATGESTYLFKVPVS